MLQLQDELHSLQQKMLESTREDIKSEKPGGEVYLFIMSAGRFYLCIKKKGALEVPEN